MGLLGVVCSIFFVRFIDRRTVLFFGCLSCGFCQLIPAIVWSAEGQTSASGKVIVTFIALFTFSYTAYGMMSSSLSTLLSWLILYFTAPYAWLVGGEFPNNQLRPFTFGLATASNFVGNWLGTFTAPYFINPAKLGWSAKYGYIWFGSNMILAVFVLLFLPETRDRTLEEIHEMFEAKLPARQFKSYVCTGVEEFAAQGIAKGDLILNKTGRAEHIETKEKKTTQYV